MAPPHQLQMICCIQYILHVYILKDFCGLFVLLLVLFFSFFLLFLSVLSCGKGHEQQQTKKKGEEKDEEKEQHEEQLEEVSLL